MLSPVIPRLGEGLLILFTDTCFWFSPKAMYYLLEVLHFCEVYFSDIQ